MSLDTQLGSYTASDIHSDDAKSRASYSEAQMQSDIVY